jgi:hypothetical protein
MSDRVRSPRLLRQMPGHRRTFSTGDVSHEDETSTRLRRRRPQKLTGVVHCQRNCLLLARFSNVVGTCDKTLKQCKVE